MDKIDKNVWHLVTKSSNDGTLGVGNIVKIDDQGFLYCKRAGTLLPDEAMNALEGVEFIKVADIDMEALAAACGEYPVFRACRRVGSGGAYSVPIAEVPSAYQREGI